MFRHSSPLHTLSTHGIPFVTDLAQQVVQFLCVSGKRGLISHGLPRAHCGVIHRLFGPKSLLELLQYRDEQTEGIRHESEHLQRNCNLIEAYLMFCKLYFNLVRLVGDFQLGVQSALCLLQPVCQLPPGLVKLFSR